MKNKYKYLMVIVLHEPKEDVCDKILKYAMIIDKIIVIDNSSLSTECINKYLLINAKITYKKNSENQGLSGPFNFALKFATEINYDFLITMDQDSVFHNDEILKIINVIESNKNNKIGIFIPRHFKILGNNYSNIIYKGLSNKKSFSYVNFAMTSGSFISVAFASKVFPIDDFFIGHIDYQISFRIIKIGGKILRINNSVLLQEVGTSTKTNLYRTFFHIVNHKDVRYYYMTRNYLYLMREFDSNLNFKIILFFNHLRILFNILIGEKNKINKFKLVNRGYLHFKNKIIGKYSD
jgi:rhamnosyltransferase